jgi:cobalt-zinc-cadmium efflux system outer membrane protein
VRRQGKRTAVPGSALLVAAILAAASGLALPAPAQPEAPPGATVEGLLALGHRLSPALRAAALDTASASARAEAAGALDDPVLSENYQRYRSGSLFSMNFITVSQTFPLWGKRDLRHRAALADVDAARGRERAARDEHDEEVKAAFARYYAFTRAVAVNKRIAGLARQARAATTARYGQGGGDQGGAIQAMSEETSVAVEGARLEAERASAAARLNALLARPPGAPLAEPQRLRPMPSVMPGIETLLERARGSNGTLQANTAEIAAAQTQRQLADRAWYPDVTVGAGPIVQTNAPTGVSATVSLSIPLQRGVRRAGEQEASARLGAAQQRFEAAMASIQGDLGQALARLEAIRRVDSLLRRQALPQAQAGYQSLLAGYGQGRGDLAAVIMAERRVHDADLELLRTEADEQAALAAVERLIGGDL